MLQSQLMASHLKIDVKDCNKTIEFKPTILINIEIYVAS
jgi:hypothetical protein